MVTAVVGGRETNDAWTAAISEVNKSVVSGPVIPKWLTEAEPAEYIGMGVWYDIRGLATWIGERRVEWGVCTA